ncbi:DUF523 domain-containing protein [Finegoldia magna]|uniref:DUF523 domain-containing protein n=1 Tax=Finegoldia magna TaxID=1260 RepID=A0A2N6SUP8_FINMA|nr:DUF523 domain-containing protein [Finegoldia magna]MDU1579754.1 DUF523 domain-containing protein [Finegoldia magna]MDU1600375.1 DUF523 domain-containing protein [Finegoldia magna]MDU4019523.1 DUF523 domain-containing protein [Finegoldia magna]OXZ26111.1 hypothetical protein B9N52_01420 [Finegoldia magna]PMC60793.1 DUF523 domain-containing protein [Finegoldia magna]
MQNVLISACLLGVDCKYNGSNNKLDDKIIHSLKEKYNLIPVCPEIMGGMPTPRNPVEISDGKVFDYDGEEFTKEFEKGSEEVVKLAKLYDATIAILKENSPSCGSNYIYDGTFNHQKIKGMGIAAHKLSKENIKLFSEENVKILL